MLPSKAAASRHSEIATCPVTDPRIERELRACVQASRDLGTTVLGFLSGYAPEAQAKWLKRTVASARFLFQPWTTEILFALAVLGQARFSMLQGLLGISSRTLSDKLQTLKEEGLVERNVHDEQPVRIEYRLTREGRVVASLATPLYARLNSRAKATPRVPGP